MPTDLEAPRIFPALRYRDSEAALAWLTGAAGFTIRFRTPDTGPPDHAELAFGSAIIMIGRVRDDDFGRIVGHPGAAGGAIYLAVDDADAAHARIAASGAEIVKGLTDKPYGSREFTCRDAEGYVWSFGTYWPKA